MASRATIRCAGRASIRVLWRGHHGGGRYAEAPLPRARVLPRGRGALAYCFSPSRSPSTRWDRPQSRGRGGTTESDKPRWTTLAGMDRESPGHRGAHLKTGGATGPLPSPLRLTVPRWQPTTLAGRPSYGKTRRVPSARNVPPAPSSSEPMSTALESGVSAAVASRRGGW